MWNKIRERSLDCCQIGQANGTTDFELSWLCFKFTQFSEEFTKQNHVDICTIQVNNSKLD